MSNCEIYHPLFSKIILKILKTNSNVNPTLVHGVPFVPSDI